MPSARPVLVVEDQPSLAETYRVLLEAAGCTVVVTGTGGTAQEALAAHRPAVVLLDLQLPDMDGLAWLEFAEPHLSETSVIVVTADGSINRAIAAMKAGAYDFLVKPVSPERLATTVRNARERASLSAEVAVARRGRKRDGFHGFVGRSAPMQAVYQAIENVADSKATVLITGESGTGKEVTAEAIHKAGRRAGKPFVAINCGAIPENLLESELFGHVKGAFTGAVDHRVGAARQAHGGTLFLDELCEMELKLQVKLLRFLQTSTIQRVGDSRTETVDVRVVCATNRNPLDEVEAGRFREDLYYRVAVIPIELPPLRERGEDIALLAQAFADRVAQEEGFDPYPLPPAVLDALSAAPWPGNVRELQNSVRRALVMTRGSASTPAHFRIANRSGPAEPSASIGGEPIASLEGMTLADLERWAVERALAREPSITAAAQALGVNASTLHRMRSRWDKAGVG